MKHQFYSFVCAAMTPGWALLIAPVPAASAEPCPDVEVVFARGTTEPPGVGDIGQSFVDTLREHVGAKSLNVYPVNYPATTDFPTAIDGINDAGTHVESMATTCPKTKMVLGGYSQGAAVMGFVTTNRVPDGAHLMEIPRPMPPEVADHVAAVTLFGKPSEQFMNAINQPPVSIGPLYTAKTIDLCVPNDPICAGSGGLRRTRPVRGGRNGPTGGGFRCDSYRGRSCKRTIGDTLAVTGTVTLTGTGSLNRIRNRNRLPAVDHNTLKR